MLTRGGAGARGGGTDSVYGSEQFLTEKLVNFTDQESLHHRCP